MGDKIQKKLSAVDRIKKLTLNLATRYNMGFLLNYSNSQTLQLNLGTF